MYIILTNILSGISKIVVTIICSASDCSALQNGRGQYRQQSKSTRVHPSDKPGERETLTVILLRLFETIGVFFFWFFGFYNFFNAIQRNLKSCIKQYVSYFFVVIIYHTFYLMIVLLSWSKMCHCINRSCIFKLF